MLLLILIQLVDSEPISFDHINHFVDMLLMNFIGEDPHSFQMVKLAFAINQSYVQVIYDFIKYISFHLIPLEYSNL
jgi:hypothetical protein